MELTKHFESVVDFRIKGRCLHDLIDIFVLILVGTIADCNDFTEIKDYGNDKICFLRQELGLKFLNGIPSEDTLDRVLRHTKPTEIEGCLRSCTQEILESLSKKHLCIDGKEHRGTIPSGSKHALIRTVSVWLVEEKLSFGQTQIATKSSEKTAIPKLLETLDIEGAIVTIDAIACQKNIIKKIIDNKADYLVALKKNAGGLFEQVQDRMSSIKEQLPNYQCINKEHGRAEQRKTYIYQHFHLLEECQEWKKLNTLIMVESTRVTNLKTTIEHRFYISSLTDKNPQTYHKLVRDHWSIENQLHWQLDLTFKEDQSRIRKDNAPLNMNIIRKFALFLMDKDHDKISMKRKRKKAARDNNYLFDILKHI